MTLSGFSLAAAQVKSKPLAIAFTNPSYSKVYAWDATNSVPVTVGTAPTNANTTTTSTDTQNHALYACTNCPSFNEISWYLSAGCYWDDGNEAAKGGNAVDYKLANNSTTKAGVWFKKKSGITSFSSTASSGVTGINAAPYFILLSSMNASDIAALHLSTDYFFLPAAGYTDGTGAFNLGTPDGYYWSSTPASTTTNAYRMHISSTGVGLNSNSSRPSGYCLWQVQ